MWNITMTILVIGVVTLALAVDLAVLIGWLRTGAARCIALGQRC
jgi:hypothetical protein